MNVPQVPPRTGPVVILGGADVQAEAVLAAQALGHQAHVVAAQCGDAARAAADAVALIDLTDIDAVTTYAQRVGAVAVCSVGSDLAMPVVAEVSERLGLHSPASRRVATLCHHKSQVRSLLQDAPGAVASVPVALGDPLPLPPPVIVKPDDGQGQRGLTLVIHEADYVAALHHALTHSRTGLAVVEEFVPGPEISVNGFVVDGQLVFAGVSDRVVWPDELGLVRAHTFPAEGARELDVLEAVDVLAAVCRRIGLLEGPVYAQMIVAPTGVRLVEVSPRLDGCHLWRLWRAVTGVDLLAATIAVACGEPVSPHLAPGDRSLLPVRTQEGVGATTIEFDCLPPGTPVPAPEVRRDPHVVERASYYAPGAAVRPCNGRLEKIGWTLSRVAPVVMADRQVQLG